MEPLKLERPLKKNEIDCENEGLGDDSRMNNDNVFINMRGEVVEIGELVRSSK